MFQIIILFIKYLYITIKLIRYVELKIMKRVFHFMAESIDSGGRGLGTQGMETTVIK